MKSKIDFIAEESKYELGYNKLVEMIFFNCLFIIVCSLTMMLAVNTLYFFYNLCSYFIKYASLFIGIYIICLSIYSLKKQYSISKNKFFYLSLGLITILITGFIISTYLNIVLLFI